MSRITAISLTNTDPTFYTTMGPYLANRRVARQIGDALHDDDGLIWIIALHEDMVVGFVAYSARRNGTVHTESCYTAEGFDRARTILMRAVIKAVKPSPVTATVRNELVSLYTRLGFTELPGRYKEFTQMIRPGE